MSALIAGDGMRLRTVSPKILMDDDPKLREISAEVAVFGDELARLVETMLEIASKRLARGLAAIQIGIPLRVMIARDDRYPAGRYEYLVFVNPIIERSLKRFEVQREGCLSLSPRFWGDVSRPAKCDAAWMDERGERQSATLEGELARIFQHELDHLDGVLMTDRLVA